MTVTFDEKPTGAHQNKTISIQVTGMSPPVRGRNGPQEPGRNHAHRTVYDICQGHIVHAQLAHRSLVAQVTERLRHINSQPSKPSTNTSRRKFGLTRSTDGLIMVSLG